MELSGVALEGLQLCGDGTRIGDNSVHSLVQAVFQIILKRKDETHITGNKDLKGVDPVVLKQAYSGLITLILEAVKTDCDSTHISSILEDCKWSSERIDFFMKCFEEQKPEIEAMLSSTGSSFPHIVDVDWRLDYYIKNNHMEKVNKPVYFITLKTEESGKSDGRDIQFSCTMEQLQDLVGKLKDASKSLEKATHL